jgi:hypothetical protein
MNDATASTSSSTADPLSTWELQQPVQIRTSSQSVGQLPPTTIMEHFQQTVQQHGNAPALHYKLNKVCVGSVVLCCV